MLPVILLSVLPVAAAWFWQRRACGMSALFFIALLAAGLLSLALAAVLQAVLPRSDAVNPVIRTALTEEGSRFVTLSFLFWALRFFKNEKPPNGGAVAGMAAGLAFAAVETAAFAAYDPLASAIRLASADILHAACGTRCAAASLSMMSGKPVRGLALFFMAVALHAVYNLMSPRGGIFTALAVLLAVSSLVSGLSYVSRTDSR
ncbi:MAG: PrsW family intramembrane metalloprotease [Spirochaetaceae bacterium]|jgi:RsiW-degrading membrane proteinase PrsW (M82 family)|nr:PrsW family intramembrane metalloprotease [Spirochaetaceae bacterium]